MTSKTTRDLAMWISEIDEQIAELQRKRDGLLVAHAHSVARDVTDEKDSAPAKQLRNAMVDMLTTEGRPMHYIEIHDRLLERGFEIPGKDTKRNVNAHLSNDQRFVTSGTGKWGLQSWSRSGASPEGPRSIDLKGRPPTLRERVRGGPVETTETRPPWIVIGDPLSEEDSVRSATGTDDVPF